jgi:uncharacterized delta-60 repeat protein
MTRRVQFLPFLAACLLILSCADPTTPRLHDMAFEDRLAYGVLTALPPVCGSATTAPLITDETDHIGTVSAFQNGDNLYVVYDVSSAAHFIQSTAISVVTAVVDIPLSGGGNPQVGRFAYKSSHDRALFVVWAIPLEEVGRDELVIAAYAAVGNRKAGAWAGSDLISPGGSWATYFVHDPDDCGAGLIDAGGGSVATPAAPGREPAVELVIPDGALDEPVAISIEPATVADLGNAVAGLLNPAAAFSSLRTAPALQSSVATVTAIDGTVWELKPNGLKFNKPVTVRIRYDRASVPDGVHEDDLRLFLLTDGTLDGPFGIPDPPRTRVEGTIEHFSYGFIGYEAATDASADLTLESLALSPEEGLTSGSAVTLTATVGSAGSDDVSDALVVYRMLGDAVSTSLGADCTDVVDDDLDGAVVVCAVGTVTAGSGGILAPSATFIVQSAGTYTAEAEVGSITDDPDPGNNTAQQEIVVVAPVVNADLRITRFADAPDPAPAGDLVTYEIDVVAAAADASIPGAQLQIRFQGSATFSTADAGCSAVAGGADCDLATLQPDQVHTVEVRVVVDDAGTEIISEATLLVPDGVVDSDLGNNSMQQTTQVIAPPEPGWIEQGTLESGEIFLPFGGTAGQQVRVHTSMLDNLSGSLQMSVEGPSGVIYPTSAGTTADGWATSLSSANAVLSLPLTGTYGIRVVFAASGPARYRVGLGGGKGRRDAAFGVAGEVRVARGTDSGNHLLDMALSGDEILTLGHRWLRRFDAAGQPAAGFGASGAVNVNTLLGGWGTALVVQPDGRIVIAARVTVSPYPWKVARFHPDGSLDLGFGTGGIVTLPFGTSISSQPVGIGLLDNGDIVVSGDAGFNLERVAIARLKTNGDLDATFGMGGTVVENGGSGFLPLKSAVQPDGSILIVDDGGIRRYLAHGARDASFGTDGLISWVADLGLSSQVFTNNVRVGAGDRILVTGTHGQDAFFMRLLPTGQPDASFAGNGWTVMDFGTADRFNSAVEDAGGNTYVIGHQRASGGDYEFLVTRFRANGELDATFGHAGYLLEHRVNNGLVVRLDTQGRIVVGGEAPGQTSFYGVEILRLLPF